MIWLLRVLLLLGCSQFAQAQLMSAYTQNIGKLNNLEKQIAIKKDEIKTLLKTISVEENDEERKAKFEQVKSEHQEYLKAVKGYNSVRRELKYKFPKKNDQTERRYLPLREQTLEEIENESGIDAVLTRVKKKVDQKYKTFTDEKPSDQEIVIRKKKVEKKKERLQLVK